MRSALLILITFLYLVITLPTIPVLWLIGKKNKNLRDRAARAMIRFVFRLYALGAGVELTVIGAERIPSDTAVLYVGNHRSIFDVILTYLYSPRVTGYIAKKQLAIPLFSVWCDFINCLFFDRDNLKEGMKMVLEGIRMLKSGISLFIFPEGTRNKAETDLPLLPFHEGSFKLASKSGCPIVPVSICNTIQIWEGHLPWIRKARVVIEFGEPIRQEDIPTEYKKQTGAYVRSLIEQTIQNNQALL